MITIIAAMKRRIEIKKMKYTIVTQASRQHLMKNIQDVEHKASEIKWLKNVATQDYFTKNKDKVKTPEEKLKFREQQSKSLEKKSSRSITIYLIFSILKKIMGIIV